MWWNTSAVKQAFKDFVLGNACEGNYGQSLLGIIGYGVTIYGEYSDYFIIMAVSGAMPLQGASAATTSASGGANGLTTNGIIASIAIGGFAGYKFADVWAALSELTDNIVFFSDSSGQGNGGSLGDLGGNVGSPNPNEPENWFQKIAKQLTNQGQYRKVDPQDLVARPNDPYSQGHRDGEAIARAIARAQNTGDPSPAGERISVWEGSDGKYYIEDGHHRWQGALEAGVKRVRVEVLGPKPPNWPDHNAIGFGP